MLIKEFAAKVDAVRRYRASGTTAPARVARTMGDGYRVTIPCSGPAEIFVVKGAEVERLLAHFPGVVGLWQLFTTDAVSAPA